jgi:hypothetical protein
MFSARRPLPDTEMGESIPTTYNYWRWAKWGGVVSGIAVVATVGVYYGGEPFIVALSSFGTAFMSLFGRSGQGSALVPVGQHTGIRDIGYIGSESQLPIVWDEEQLRLQEFLSSPPAYYQEEELEKIRKEFGISDFEDEDDEDNELDDFKKREALTASTSSSSTSSSGYTYFTDFSGSVGPEWSVALIDHTPAGNNPFLGRFGNDAVNLTLTALPTHNRVQIGFDLYIIQSWDGNHNNNDPDRWILEPV